MARFIRGLALLSLLLVIAGVAYYVYPKPITVLTITPQALTQRLVVTGEVNSQGLAQVGSEVAGQVLARHVREGDHVEAGQLLVELVPDTLNNAKQQAQLALTQLLQVRRPQAQSALQERILERDQRQREFERRKTLHSRNLMSQEVLEQARKSHQQSEQQWQQANLTWNELKPNGVEEQRLREALAKTTIELEKTRIRAPVAGVVQQRSVEVGDQVQPHQILLSLAAANSLDIRLAVDERLIAPLAAQQPVTVVSDAYPDRWLSGHIYYLAPQVDSERGTLDAFVRLDETPAWLLQGMTVSASITLDEQADALVIPLSAIDFQANNAQVRLLQDSTLRWQPIRIAQHDEQSAQVLEGLSAGEHILAQPYQTPFGRFRAQSL